MNNIDENYESKNPFCVPEGYFDTLEDRILENVKKESKPVRPKVVHILKPYMGIAAMFLFAILVVQVIFPRLIDTNRMIVNRDAMKIEVVESDFMFDSDFNPTNEEILEYLSQEADPVKFFYSEVRL